MWLGARDLDADCDSHSVGKAPRRTALIQLCYREPGDAREPPFLGPVPGREHEQLPNSFLEPGIGSPSPPYTCLLLHVAHTGISLGLAALLGDAGAPLVPAGIVRLKKGSPG